MLILDRQPCSTDVSIKKGIPESVDVVDDNKEELLTVDIRPCVFHGIVAEK